jgi:hypothetical protein
MTPASTERWHMGRTKIEWMKEELKQEAEVARDLFGELLAHKPVKECLGDVRGMLRHLKTRPLTKDRILSPEELELVECLRDMQAWGELLIEEEDGTPEAEVEALLYAEMHFAMTQDFFQLLGDLGEAFPV